MKQVTKRLKNAGATKQEYETSEARPTNTKRKEKETRPEKCEPEENECKRHTQGNERRSTPQEKEPETKTVKGREKLDTVQQIARKAGEALKREQTSRNERKKKESRME